MDLHAERLAKVEAQVESLKEDVSEVKADIKDLHSRISTGNREILQKIDEKIDDLANSDRQQHQALKETMESVKTRVDILEKWRWMIVGGAIVLGFAVGHLDFFIKLLK